MATYSELLAAQKEALADLIEQGMPSSMSIGGKTIQYNYDAMTRLIERLQSMVDKDAQAADTDAVRPVRMHLTRFGRAS